MSEAEWVGRDGTRYAVQEMTEDHIRRCVAMIRRQLPALRRELADEIGEDISYIVLTRGPAIKSGEQWLQVFEDELQRRRNTAHTAGFVK